MNTIYQAVYEIPELCTTFKISRSKLYDEWAAGRGPRRFNIGKKVLVTGEAAAEWIRSLESADQAA